MTLAEFTVLGFNHVRMKKKKRKGKKGERGNVDWNRSY